MLNPGSTIFDDVFRAGQNARNCEGIGLDKYKSKEKVVVLKSRILLVSHNFAFVGSTLSSKVFTSQTNSLVRRKSGERKIVSKPKTNQYVPIFHLCGVKGHIRPKCFTSLILLKENYVKFNNPKFITSTKCHSKEV